MRDFAELYRAIDETNRTTEKVTAMAQYFAAVPPEDAILAVSFLIGRRPKRLVKRPDLITWAVEAADLPQWLFDECYDAIGDLAETIANVLQGDGEGGEEHSLNWWVSERLLPLAKMDPALQRESLLATWKELSPYERFVWNKLITGSFRVGVSQELVVRALSQVSKVPVPTLAHRLMGNWDATPDFFRYLIAEDEGESHHSRPYPFCLAYALEGEPSSLGERNEWLAEWKWDGIRCQIVRRNGETFVWSRGEELISERFPEIVAIGNSLPDGTALDGEILAWGNDRPLPFAELQKRIGRKVLTKKILEDVPAAMVAFDLLEWNGEDLRVQPLSERRALLEALVASEQVGNLKLSKAVPAATWEALFEERLTAREANVEGVMLKRLDSPYLVGRKKGSWWKWKIDPLTVDAVLIYATRGSGKRASLYTDYTFGIWREGQLVSFAKAYSGLTDAEILEVDRFVRNNTLEKFGPVRTVKPELVMELAFEGIQVSTRHKSGVAVRFPRIARLRPDKKPEDADSLETVLSLLGAKA